MSPLTALVRRRRRYLPHRRAGLFVHDPRQPGLVLPVTMNQVIGGRRWSLALVQIRPAQPVLDVTPEQR